ncbi:MAG: hypothetical protein IJX77_00185 [Ruminococcus sp.]|nr:hypothetical protein [Ruminococcus sp.]
MTRISAEFETPDLAEIALKRIRDTVQGVYSTNIMYNKTSERAVRLRSGSIYTIIPTAVTTHTYLTAVMESPASEDVIKEPYRSRKTYLYVICEPESVQNVKAILSAMGGLRITSPEKK